MVRGARLLETMEKPGLIPCMNARFTGDKIPQGGDVMAEYPDFEKTCGYGSVTGIGGANCR